MKPSAALCALALAACAHPQPSGPATAQVALELHVSSARRASVPVRAVALVDVTPVVADETVTLPSRRDHDGHACRVARDWLDALSDGTTARIQRFRRTPGEGATCALPTAGVAQRDDEIWQVTSAVDALERLEREPAIAERVTWMGDLAPEADAPLCSIAARLARRGSWLEVVRLDAGAWPDCLTGPRPIVAGPPPALAPSHVPGFRIVRPDDGAVLARGRAGDPSVDVPVGSALLVLEVEPEQRIGPFFARIGALTRIRVFELADPDGAIHYEWRLEASEHAR